MIFDVTKPLVDVQEDIDALARAKCKRLLAEMKQKMSVVLTFDYFEISSFLFVHRLATRVNENSKMCKVWFYGENQYIRNRTNLLTLNESASN